MNKLLSAFTEVGLPLIVLAIAIGLCVLLYIVVKKKFNKPLIDVSLQKNAKLQIKLKEKYCTEKEMRFLEALHKALPRECISFPNVGVSNLVEPKGSLIAYKAVLDKFVDICVFLRRDMKPILVIDLYESSPAAQQFKKFDDNVTAVLKEVKIPILHKEIEEKYNIDELRINILSAMDSATVSYLKDNIIKQTTKN